MASLIAAYRAALAGARAVPMEAHHLEQEVFELGGVFRRHDDRVPEAKEAFMEIASFFNKHLAR